jgi:predicted O-methyltransferase YrrM
MSRMQPLSLIVTDAWETGRAINLDGIGYGPPFLGNQSISIDYPWEYYYFLAGLVRTQQLSRILEIGTYCGGSAKALLRGTGSANGALVVTVDVTDESDKYLAAYPKIQKINGDANDTSTIHAVLSAFNFEPIDLLFIDASHTCLPTLLNFCIYTSLLRPRFVALDDITLNDSMSEMWSCITRTLTNDQAIDATTIVPKIRPSWIAAPGFGLVRYRHAIA